MGRLGGKMFGFLIDHNFFIVNIAFVKKVLYLCITNNIVMTINALNNLWTYLQGLHLSQSDREWLANKLVMPKDSIPELTKEERKAAFLRLAGCWSDAEGEEYYQMMKHRNDDRPAHREVNFDD